MKRIAWSLAVLFVCSAVTFALPQKAVLDFDGDNKTDYAVVRNVSNKFNWYIQRSMAGFLGQAWGTFGDQFVPADYDGDGKWDIAVWRSGTPASFFILQSQTGTLRVVQFGQTGDNVLITQDFDGDGKADPAVVRNVANSVVWYIQRSLLGFTSITFGNPANDTPCRGDFDGDGKADVVIYRDNFGTPANTFYVLRSSDGGVQGQTFGTFNSDYIVPGDFDGDGKTDYAVWRGSGTGTNGVWYWLNSTNGSFHALAFGIGGSLNTGDFAVPGDYDGDGKTDQAVFRPGTTPTFYVNRSMQGFTSFPFGTMGDQPAAFSSQVH